jgi:hypothetical protein
MASTTVESVLREARKLTPKAVADTHTVIWYLKANPQLSPSARLAIALSFPQSRALRLQILSKKDASTQIH